MIPSNCEGDYVDDETIDLSTYDRVDLIGFIDLNDLDVDVTDEMSDDEIRDAIVKASESEG